MYTLQLKITHKTKKQGFFKMVEEWVDIEYCSPHWCIRDTSTDATVLTEHWLNTSRSPDHQKGPYGSMHNWLWWKKEGRRGASRTNPHPGVRELNQGRDSCIWWNWLRQKGSIWRYQRGVKQLTRESLDRVRNTDNPSHDPKFSRLGFVSAGACGDWEEHGARERVNS